MKQLLLWILNITTLLLTILFGTIWINRLQLEYNNEGKYFDEINQIVYDTDARLVYGILTFCFVLAGLFLWIYTWKLFLKKRATNLNN